jgi:hypothetical protein
MDIVLDPPLGAGPVRLGMTPDEAVAAVSPWGRPEVKTGDDETVIHTKCREIPVTVFLEGAGDAVTAVELWWPGEGRRTDVRVLLYGDDVFTTPAEDLFRRVEERGWTVDRTEPEHPFVPGVCLGFTRQTSQEVPRTQDGLPVHVTAVLVAGEHYYDVRLRGDL